MDVLLLSQEEAHPLYAGIHAYFAAPLLANRSPKVFDFSRIPPLGVTLLATYLNERGVRTAVINNPFSLAEERRRFLSLLATRPLAVGISTTHLFSASLFEEIVQTVRELSPATKIISGGPIAAWNRDIIERSDVTVLGHAEKTLFEVIDALRSGQDLAAVPNIIYKYAGGWSQTARRGDYAPDDAPFPDWGLYEHSPKRVSLQGSWGCSRRCAFCSYPKGGLALRSPERILAEIRHDVDRHAVDFIRFTDSDFACDGARAKEICRGIIGLGKDVHWTCFARADSLLDGELLTLMKESGCLWVFIGAESGSDAILKGMKKGLDAATLQKAFALIKSKGLNSHANFVVGFPGETRETLDETMAFIRKVPMDTVYFSPFQIRSPDIDIYARKGESGLEGDYISWKHSTMDSASAAALARGCMETVFMEMERPLLATEISFSYMIGGAAADFPKNVFTLFGAYRDYHRSLRKGDKESAAENLRVILETP